jgi:hypothetical protein
VVNEEAARTDPMVRREIARIVALRRAGIARLARTLRGVEAARSAAILDALTLPEVYRALVVVHGWSADDFEMWLGRVLKRQFG